MIIAYDAAERIGRFARRRPFSTALRTLLAAALVSAFAAAKQRPRDDRNWVAHLAQLPVVAPLDQSDGGQAVEAWAITGVRNWGYLDHGPISTGREDRSLALGDIQRIWFVVEPHPSLERWMAHTLVLFELSGDSLIGLTIEARRETDEKYDPLAGALNAFELAYVWASAKDLLTRRAVHLRHTVRIYPLDLTADQRAAFASRLLEKTRALETRPRFYNTVFSNCTNELAKTADLPWNAAFILTGRSAHRLYRDGLIVGETFDAVQVQSDLTQTIRSLNWHSSADFDAKLLAELRGRANLLKDPAHP